MPTDTLEPAEFSIEQHLGKVKAIETEIQLGIHALEQLHTTLCSARATAESVELDGLEGDAYFRKRYSQVRRLYRSLVGEKNDLKAKMKLLRAKIDQTIVTITNLDQESEENDLPLLAAAKQQGAEGWRTVTVHNLTKFGLPEGVAQSLEDGGLKTVGALSDWKSQDKWFTDIKGIGEANADKIDEAMEKLFADWSKDEAA